MAGQAQRVVVRAARDFPVGDLVITVGQIEGTVQMIVTRDGWVPIPQAAYPEDQEN